MGAVEYFKLPQRKKQPRTSATVARSLAMATVSNSAKMASTSGECAPPELDAEAACLRAVKVLSSGSSSSRVWMNVSAEAPFLSAACACVRACVCVCVCMWVLRACVRACEVTGAGQWAGWVRSERTRLALCSPVPTHLRHR